MHVLTGLFAFKLAADHNRTLMHTPRSLLLVAAIRVGGFGEVREGGVVARGSVPAASAVLAGPEGVMVWISELSPDVGRVG